jgi:hypothetical protein
VSREPVILVPGQPDFYADTKWERKPSGVILIDNEEVASTICCPHCNSHFISRKGSGERRAFCINCKAVTCGRPACDACVPFEKKMERLEKRFRGKREL